MSIQNDDDGHHTLLVLRIEKKDFISFTHRQEGRRKSQPDASLPS
jgi:hypothetical protein